MATANGITQDPTKGTVVVDASQVSSSSIHASAVVGSLTVEIYASGSPVGSDAVVEGDLVVFFNVSPGTIEVRVTRGGEQIFSGVHTVGAGVVVEVRARAESNPSPSPVATFTPLGNVDSRADAVSGDGSVVVGSGSEGAFRWTASEGMDWLGGLPGDSSGHVEPEAVSANGAVVAGTSSDNRAVRWTASGGMVALSELPSQGEGISADGSVVVGHFRGASPSAENEAFRWTASGGLVGLGTLSGGVGSAGFTGSYAWDVSADGAVVVGDSESASGLQAFRWTASGGMVGLGDLPGGPFHSTATATSCDASVVVGVSASDPSHSDDPESGEAFRWTASGGMVGLGTLGPDSNSAYGESHAWAVSCDGSIVVGSSLTSTGQRVVFIWDATRGMRNLQEVLTHDFGLDLTGWVLKSASGLSADGLTIVGTGFNPSGDGEAWVVTLPHYP
jgi:probable HAF family extracellular repeat protein